MMKEMFGAGDNRDKKGESSKVDDPSRREFLTTLGSGAALGALAMDAVSDREGTESLLSAEIREAIKRKDPEVLKAARNMVRMYAGLLGTERMNGEEMERQLKSLTNRNPGNRGTRLLERGIRLSKKQQEVYGRAMWELLDAVEPSARQPGLNLKPSPSPKPRNTEA